MSGKGEGESGKETRRSFPLSASLLRLFGAGGTGFLVVSVASLATIVGLWAVARGAPSAEPMPTPRPSPTATGSRDRFGAEPFPTARAVVRRTPILAPAGSGLPRRGSQASPVALEGLLPSIHVGDATGDPVGGGGRAGGDAALPPTPETDPVGTAR